MKPLSSAHSWALLFPQFRAIWLIFWARGHPIWLRSFFIELARAAFSFTIIFAITSISFGLLGSIHTLRNQIQNGPLSPIQNPKPHAPPKSPPTELEDEA